MRPHRSQTTTGFLDGLAFEHVLDIAALQQDLRYHADALRARLDVHFRGGGLAGHFLAVALNGQHLLARLHIRKAHGRAVADDFILPGLERSATDHHRLLDGDLVTDLLSDMLMGRRLSDQRGPANQRQRRENNQDMFHDASPPNFKFTV
jgi:hypothetical protein